MWYLLFALITLTLFLVPFIPAILEWKTKTDVDPLYVSSDYKNDVTFFAKGFGDFLRKNFADFMGGSKSSFVDPANILLENGTSCHIIGKTGIFQLSPSEESKRFTKRLMLSHHALTLQDRMLFESEIYSSDAIITGKQNIFRAMLAAGNITFAAGNKVLRWVHSDSHIAAAGNCEFYGRISAAKSISLVENTRFQRIHAPAVYFGPITEAAAQPKTPLIPAHIEDLAKVIDVSAGRWLVDGDLTIPEYSSFTGNLVAKGNVTIGKGSVIRGSIKANGDMTIGEQVTITGSLVSVKDLKIGAGGALAGPVISEMTVSIGKGTIVGAETVPTTVSAKKLHIEPNVVCYGTLWAVEWGFVKKVA